VSDNTTAPDASLSMRSEFIVTKNKRSNRSCSTQFGKLNLTGSLVRSARGDESCFGDYSNKRAVFCVSFSGVVQNYNQSFSSSLRVPDSLAARSSK